MAADDQGGRALVAAMSSTLPRPMDPTNCATQRAKMANNWRPSRDTQDDATFFKQMRTLSGQ